jgi:hypothetical protein
MTMGARRRGLFLLPVLCLAAPPVLAQQLDPQEAALAHALQSDGAATDALLDARTYLRDAAQAIVNSLEAQKKAAGDAARERDNLRLWLKCCFAVPKAKAK